MPWSRLKPDRILTMQYVMNLVSGLGMHWVSEGHMAIGFYFIF